MTYDARADGEQSYLAAIAAKKARGDTTYPKRSSGVVIELPWPDKVLLPNTRCHWAKRAKAAKHQRTTAAACTLAAGVRRTDPDIQEAVKATITFHAPDNRRRDIDNMLSACKAAIDGVADIIGRDDSTWSISITKAEPRPPHGLVRIELGEQ